PRGLPRLRGLRDRSAGRPRRRPAADRRALGARPAPPGAPGDHLAAGPDARRMDHRMGEHPMSDRISTPTAAAIPERFRAAFGDWTPSAVVFDCDGMLLDTETVWQRTQDAAVAELAAELTDADEQELHGSTIEVAAEIIAERATRGA